MTHKKNQGMAAILTVFVIGIFSILLGLSMVQSGSSASLRGRTGGNAAQALYGAHSGVEDAIRQITELQPAMATYLPYEYEFTSGSVKTQVKITGTADNRVIESIGQSGKYVKKVTAKIQISSTIPGFQYAVHAGSGGFELDGNSIIQGSGGSLGNVYSNGYIKGKSNSHTAGGVCKSASSHISGFASAHGALDALSPGDGACVSKNASASALLKCFVTGDMGGPTNDPAECTSKGSYDSTAQTPPILPLPDMHISEMETYMNGHAQLFTQTDCTVDFSGGLSDCSDPFVPVNPSARRLGNKIITRDLTLNIPSGKTLLIDGPVWVKRNVTITSNSTVSIFEPSPLPSNPVSQIFLVDGKITSNSNVTYGWSSVGSMFLLFLSRYQTTNPDMCLDPAITINANIGSVLFYAQKGCARVKTTGSDIYHGSLLGEEIYVESNAIVEYEPKLGSAKFGWTSSGGWEIVSFVIE